MVVLSTNPANRKSSRNTTYKTRSATACKGRKNTFILSLLPKLETAILTEAEETSPPLNSAMSFVTTTKYILQNNNPWHTNRHRIFFRDLFTVFVYSWLI